MITSLNVNNFVMQRNWMDLQGDFKEKSGIWNKCKDYYFNYINNHVKSDSDVLVLHEVPYIKEKSYKDKTTGEIKYKRSVIKADEVKEDNYCESYNELIAFCKDNNLDVHISKSEETAFFITLAICKNNKYKVCTSYFKSYEKRVVVLENIDNPKDVIIGVHVKDDDYWKQLIELFQKTSKVQKKDIVIIGDMNVFIPGTSQKKRFNELLAKGLCDVWIENGNSNFDVTYVCGHTRTRIDYALLSDSCCNNYNIYKNDSTRLLGYSDHSAITINKIV